MAEVGLLEAQPQEPLRRQPGVPMRMIDRPWRRANATFVVQHVTEKKRGLRSRVKTDAARRVSRAVHHRQPGDDVAILEEPGLTGGRTDDVPREPFRQPLGDAPQRHPVARPARLQVRRIVAMHRQPRAGRLAQRERRPRVVDVVMGQDHPVDRTQGACLEESKHRPRATRIAGIDDGQPFVATVHEGLRAANARNRRNHASIIPAPLPPPLAGEGRVGALNVLLAKDGADSKHRQPGEDDKRSQQQGKALPW